MTHLLRPSHIDILVQNETSMENDKEAINELPLFLFLFPVRSLKKATLVTTKGRKAPCDTEPSVGLL